jgi:hypothetical protein
LATLRLRRDDLLQAEMPAVCAKTGEPATTTILTFARPPVPNAAKRVALGVLPYFFARAYRVERVPVDLPAGKDAHARVRRRTYVTRVTSLASIMVLVVGIGARYPAILIGALLLGLVSLAAALAAEVAWVDATVDDETIVLDRVHPGFVRTLAMRGTRPARRLRSSP